LRYRLDNLLRVSLRVSKMRRILHVDTQRTRQRLIARLEEIFEISSDYARGRVKRVVDEHGVERELTVVERQFWARIATYSAQIINSIAKGIDERQIDQDLDKLEAMLNKTASAVKTEAVSSEPPGKSEGT